MFRVSSLSLCSLLPTDLRKIEVIASTPSKLVLQTNNISTICGASTPDIVHHKHINKLSIQPLNPQTRLLDIALFPVNNWIQNSLNFISRVFKIIYANLRIIWNFSKKLLYLPVEIMCIRTWMLNQLN